MKSAALILLAVFLAGSVEVAQAQDFARSFSEGYERGRKIREEREARQREEEERAAARERAERERIEEANRKRKEEEGAELREEVVLARNNPSVIFRSKNDLPEIVLSEQVVRICNPPAKVAFTRDAEGSEVVGCAFFEQGFIRIDWLGYGTRNYELSAWTPVEPPSADEVPLGR